ncbi:MAG TPA: carbamoyltransferase [Gammaproteobacteria bacterium]|nr:carbamoyltransferase [Gammaproteobacteria bacterium]
MYVLGINAFHGDSSAAILLDGKLVAAVEEERFLRVKHWAGFPAESIAYCLREAGIKLGQLDVIAVNQDVKANLWRKIAYSLLKKPDLTLIADRLKNRKSRLDIPHLLDAAFPGEKFTGVLQTVEHHLAHLSSAFHVSPFDEAVVVSVDGFGDFSSAAWGIGKGAEIEVLDRVYFPHSLGIFYQALTQYLGFPHYGDEYKVMGLAPYGKPSFLSEMRELVSLQENAGYALNLDYFIHQNEKITESLSGGAPEFATLYSAKLTDLLGPARQKDEALTQKHFDVARSIQAMYEEAFFHLLNTLYARTGVDKLCLSGGCAMNSVANGKIYRNTSFKAVYIQSAAGDAGGAIGSAYSAWHTLVPAAKRHFVMDHAYYGPSYSNEYIEHLLKAQRIALNNASCKTEYVSNASDLFDRTAKAISEGKVIGWFQGRLEWGPRALGNRSILGDPRREDMKDILNLKIKRRESFRPFAPSILREKVSEWFEEEDDVPFMMEVFQIREDKRSLIPAVTHVDGSGRLQTVTETGNPRYHALIQAFNSLTGVPVLLNTSFNENEPIVCKPEEALACFLRTKMDVLVMGDWLVARN